MHWMEVAERSNWLWLSDADYRTTGANRYRYTPPTHGFPCWADIKQYNRRYWGRSGGFGTRARSTRHARRRKEKIFLSSLCLALRVRKPNLAWSPPIRPVKSEGATILVKTFETLVFKRGKYNSSWPSSPLDSVGCYKSNTWVCIAGLLQIPYKTLEKGRCPKTIWPGL